MAIPQPSARRELGLAGKRIAWSVAGAGFLSLALWLAYLTVEIHRESTAEGARPSDVIVVMGAAEYSGSPSPVLKARLDHALELYRKGLAPLIITTGGAGGDPVYTEGEVGRAYLIKHDIPSEAILVESEGESTGQSTASVAEIMRRMGLRSCILVSDGYHILRTKRMLQFRGLTVHGSPRSSMPATGFAEWRKCARQAVAYLLWSVGINV